MIHPNSILDKADVNKIDVFKKTHISKEEKNNYCSRNCNILP